MSTRTVIVASSAGKAQKIENFAGTTWGELKAHPQVAPLLVGDLEAVVNPGKVTLRDNESLLPSTDFKVYLIPTKNKAGTVTQAQAATLGQQIADAILKASQKAQGDEMEQLKESLIEAVEEFFDVDLNDFDDCPECEDAVAEAQQFARR
jgi:hypothetical protein